MGMSIEEFSSKVRKLKLLLDNKMITKEQFTEVKEKLMKDMKKGDTND